MEDNPSPKTILMDQVRSLIKTKVIDLKTLGELAESSEKLGKTRPQLKAEKWLQIELAMFLKRSNQWKEVGVEVDNRSDIVVESTQTRERIHLELKDYTHSQQTPLSNSRDMKGIEKDIEILNRLQADEDGISCVLISRDNFDYHDKFLKSIGELDLKLDFEFNLEPIENSVYEILWIFPNMTRN